MAEIKYEIVERIAVLGERPRGWERQLNLISWNEGEPKYDIRDWSPDGTRMGKGISLSHDELAILKGILEDMEIFRTHITRPGSEKLLDWMDSKTDFFSAPASTRFHGACDGGLCAHSLNVYRVLHGTFFTPDEDSEETFAICALLHDLCKANFYKKGTRNVKNEATGQWEKVPSYSVEDMFPYGHGEKSVFLIERFMKLKVEEAVAIRWHMGGFDDAVRGGSFAMSGAFEKYPLAVKLHIADLEATYLLEQRGE